MKILQKLNTWQKGAFFGFCFALVISIILSASVGSSYFVNRSQFCLTFTRSLGCTASALIEVVLNMFFRSLLIFGPIIIACAAMIGVFIMRMSKGYD